MSVFSFTLNIIHGLISFQVWDTGAPMGGED